MTEVLTADITILEWIQNNTAVGILIQVLLLIYGIMTFISLLQNAILVMIRRSHQLKLDVQSIVGALQTAMYLKGSARQEMLTNIERKIKIWTFLSWFLKEEFLPNSVLQKFHKVFGRCAYSCNNFSLAVKHYETLRLLIDKSERSKEGKVIDKAVVGMHMADINHKRGRSTDAITQLEESIESFLRFNDYQLASQGFQKLASIHWKNNNWARVTTSLKKAISLCQKLRPAISPDDLALQYKELGKSLRNTANQETDSAKKRKVLNEAVSTYEQALKFFEAGDSGKWSREISMCYKHLGEIHSKLNNQKASKSWHAKHKQITSTMKEDRRQKSHIKERKPSKRRSKSSKSSHQN